MSFNLPNARHVRHSTCLSKKTIVSLLTSKSCRWFTSAIWNDKFYSTSCLPLSRSPLRLDTSVVSLQKQLLMSFERKIVKTTTSTTNTSTRRERSDFSGVQNHFLHQFQMRNQSQSLSLQLKLGKKKSVFDRGNGLRHDFISRKVGFQKLKVSQGNHLRYLYKSLYCVERTLIIFDYYQYK